MREKITDVGLVLQQPVQVAVIVAAYIQRLHPRRPVLVDQVSGNIELRVIAGVAACLFRVGWGRRHKKTVCPLGRDQGHAIHGELIFLGLAAEQRVVVKQEAGASLPGMFSEMPGSAQPRHAAADYHHVIFLIDGHGIGKVGITAVAQAVCGIDDFGRVAVGRGVISCPTVAVPVRSHLSEPRGRGGTAIQ